MSSLPDLTTRTSVIVVTRAGADEGREVSDPAAIDAVRSLRATSRHRDLELIVVHDDDVPFFTLLALSQLPEADVLLVPFTGAGGLAARFNRGALHASGDVLVFVDDRTVARTDEALGHLIAPLSDSSVGAVGPKLLLADDRIDHAGTMIKRGRLVHLDRLHPNAADRLPDLFVDRDVDALSSAALAVRSTAFHAVGGWSLEAPEPTRAIDFSLKVRREGLRLRWLNAVEMFHFASGDAYPDLAQWERDFLVRRWGARLRPPPPSAREGVRTAPDPTS